jgi:putative peptide zinc metalloprotease protein
MDQTAHPSELERRKLVRIRLRTDLAIEAQKYEGRTYYVVKDPVSLRYYRLKDNEHYLLQFMDGERTLEDAQKAYEAHYRPDRVKLEDLEGFAQQLLTAGLAHNESPRAGKQLFDRRKKRRRSEWMQTLTNILYIKIPIIDPDRLLNGMLRYVGWIFSTWFFVLSVGLMLSALLLVGTHFDTFRSKLPSYHEFFSFKTVVYLWGALAVVKVIHEFGHGLSCKVFGGEVHEMGFLLLCFSPALYCNVSDAWTLPSKWHRIIISFAGIYVELVIASIFTFVWWNSPSQPFLNNLSLALMIVCSVSTVVFNANPLMRYDGYYVLADWLEIPNLRERSNRFLKNVVLEFCLGVEVQPEPYMALWRRVLFVVYAIVSYIYRWVVTFAILYFMSSFLGPKLKVISQMLAVAAASSMVGWPLYRLGKNLHRRGRVPDMKRWRVLISATVLTGVVLFLFLVPVPVSRVRGVGLVQSHPDAFETVFVRHSGILERLKVRDGQYVNKGDELAEFTDRELEAQLDAARTEVDNGKKRLDDLERQKTLTNDPNERGKIEVEMSKVRSDRDKAATTVLSLTQIKRRDLLLVAPRSGVVSGAPRIDDVGKFYDEKETAAPFCTIHERARLRVCLPLETHEFNHLREDLERQSSAARDARKLLDRKVSVKYERTPLAEVFKDLKSKAKGLTLAIDPELGESEVKTLEGLEVTFQAEQQKVLLVLDRVLALRGLGYIIQSDEADKRDGWLLVRPGRERIYPEGPRPFAALPVTVRVQGRDSHTWEGRLSQLPESEAADVPVALSNRAGGPVAVKTGATKSGKLIPQTQHYLIYIDILDPGAIAPSGSRMSM